MLKIYNSLTKRKEDFKPINPGEVRMYACGITVYDECHLGHAMQAVFFDVIRRYLEYSGLKVVYVRNYTDIDDKIIARAASSGRDPLELSEFYVKDSRSDMKNLKVLPATFEPKVSDHVPDIIAFISRLIEKKHAYVSGGEVFFSVSSFPGYGKLSNRRPDELEPDADAAPGKEAPHDFSLWKPVKPGEPSWDSPWGRGRPGWHIECSVLSFRYLGPTFDIHGGGLDIIFPHHENEIAQSEAANGVPFANYWIHNGLLMVENRKMSKSLGNFMTIKKALSEYQADVIRHMILSFSISSNVNFTSANLAASNKNVLNYYRILAGIKEVVSSDPAAEERDSGREELDGAEEVFRKSMDDFFNSALFLASLPETFRVLSEILVSGKIPAPEKAAVFRKFLSRFAKITAVLGILDEEPGEYLAEFTRRYILQKGLDVSEIERKINERNAARGKKDFKTADLIRGELLKAGVALQDSPDGTKWTAAL